MACLFLEHTLKFRSHGSLFSDGTSPQNLWHDLCKDASLAGEWEKWQRKFNQFNELKSAGMLQASIGRGQDSNRKLT